MNNYKSIWQKYSKSKAELSLEEYERLQLEIAYLKKQLTTQSKLVQKLKGLAYQDSLTCVWNRRKFQQDLDKILEYNNRYGRVSGVLFLDLNHFKSINDNLGHLAGDFVLQHLATTLKKNNRLNDEVYRLSGDEFAIILPKTDEAQLQIKSNFLSELIQNSPCIYKDKKIYISASIGGSIVTEDTTGREEIIEVADKQMYKLKKKYHMQAASA